MLWIQGNWLIHLGSICMSLEVKEMSVCTVSCKPPYQCFYGKQEARGDKPQIISILSSIKLFVLFHQPRRKGPTLLQSHSLMSPGRTPKPCGNSHRVAFSIKAYWTSPRWAVMEETSQRNSEWVRDSLQNVSISGFSSEIGHKRSLCTRSRLNLYEFYNSEDFK